ncbi:MAG TPA: hypothetical protein VHH34_10685, partial [Pseudonocardiaceae bacterium]|nr:hypothetical protein [Pseudonocardiaceae bacterium]
VRELAMGALVGRHIGCECSPFSSCVPWGTSVSFEWCSSPARGGFTFDEGVRRGRNTSANTGWTIPYGDSERYAHKFDEVRAAE